MLLFAAAADARRLRTTRKPLKAIETECPEGAVPDTTVSALIVTAEEGCRQAVRLFGYEKTVNATRETVFVENLTGQPVTAVSFTIRYLDADGRMIHQRTVSRHRVHIPAGKSGASTSAHGIHSAHTITWEGHVRGAMQNHSMLPSRPIRFHFQ